MLSISQFSKIAYITTKALRYYDEIGLLKPAQVDYQNGYRYYSAKQLHEVLLIQKLKYYNFTLDEIKAVIEGTEELEKLLKIKQTHINEQMLMYSHMRLSIEKDIEKLIKGEKFMGNEYNYKIELFEDYKINVFSIRRTIDIKNYSIFMQEVLGEVTRLQLTPSSAPMTIYHSMEYTPEEYDTEIAIPVLEKTNETKLFTANTCAKLYYIGQYENIPKMYAFLNQWIEENKYQLNGSPFEVYLTDPSITSPDKNEIELYFPISIKL